MFHCLQWVFAPVVTTINTFPLHSKEWLILLPWFMFRAALKFQEFGVKSSQALTNEPAKLRWLALSRPREAFPSGNSLQRWQDYEVEYLREVLLAYRTQTFDWRYFGRTCTVSQTVSELCTWATLPTNANWMLCGRSNAGTCFASTNRDYFGLKL